jgi:hypothetical protein
MSFGIFLNTMNRLGLRKLDLPAAPIYILNAVAYGAAAPVIVWIVYRCVLAVAPVTVGYGLGGIYLIALLGPPVLGGALGTILTSSDYDRRLKGVNHLIALGFSLILYVGVLCLGAKMFGVF